MYKGKDLSDYYMICTSSGSTNEPTIWPRSYKIDQTLIDPHTAFLNKHFQISKKRTLILISLMLGTTQAGMMHLQASWGANKSNKVSVISPNGDPENTLFLIQNLYKYYDQIVCLGYPPLISDFIDLALNRNLPIHKWNLKIGTTSESTSPIWRNELLKILNCKEKDIISWYGTTETGMIGFETKEANSIISSCIKNKKFRFDTFGTYNLPTLVELDTLKKYIEIIKGEIVVTVDQVVPLVRYNLHDKGLLITNHQIRQVALKNKIKNIQFDKKNRLYLAVFGRNMGKIFSIEDIRYLLDKLNIYDLFHYEFQFKEQSFTNTIKLEITLYKRKNKTISETKKENLVKIITENLQNIAKIPSKFILILKIKRSDEQIGYKFGKLRYILESGTK